jgi:hypothetical protein
MIPAMSHGRGPADDNFVAGSKAVFDRDVNVGERAANALDEGDEVGGAVNITLPGLSFSDSVRGKQFVNGFDLAFVPYFAKPAVHELEIFFGRHGG